ncbi:MAG: alginate export family protein [Pseudomonadota bacterium]
MKYFVALAFAACLISSPALATMDPNDPEILITDGEFFGEIRYRYEHVEQGSFANDADAHTVRTNVGFKTGTFKNFQALFEGQIVQNVAEEDFNSLDNGQTTFPVVADPNTGEINRAWIAYSGIPDTNIKIGRQAMNIDNQRFIGTVGWRQNDQTFDALSITNESIDKFSFMYSYIHDVNRIFEGSTPPDDLDSESHIAGVSYNVADWLKLKGYGYWLEFDNAAALSSQTYGIRATGDVPIANTDWTFFYEAEAATQEDYGNNTASYDEEYYHIAPGIKGHGFSLKVGYEELGGNGTNAFQTPLATLHKFNGWSDQFLATPAAGLEDTYVAASYKVSGTQTHFDGTKLHAAYHEFDGDSSGDFGSELNLSVGKTFKIDDGFGFDSVSLLVKYADYDAEDAPRTDTEKLWFQIGFKF